MRPIAKPDFSYRTDRSVPEFDESRILLIMDGECALCSAAARRIATLDHRDEIRIAPANSGLGTAILRHYGLNPDDPQSWLMVREGRAYGSLDAIIRLGGRLHPLMRVMGVFRVLPLPAQDWLYARLARNRYSLFGHGDLCAMPDAELKRRLTG